MRRAKFILLTILFCSGSVSLNAQNQLERISIAERGDGLGLVMRFHLTQMADSFNVSQPATDLVQVRLYSNNLEITDLLYLSPRRDIRRIEFYPFPDGVGVDIRLVEENFFRARMYPDQNLTHLLLSLEYSNRNEIEAITTYSAFLFGDDKQGQAIVTEEQVEIEPEHVFDPVEEFQIRFFQRINRRDTSPALQRITPGDPLELYLRFITNEHIDGWASQNLRSANIDHEKLSTAIPLRHPWMNHPYFQESKVPGYIEGLAFFTPSVYTSHNTNLPWGQNDGALWQGAGINHMITTGIGYQYGPVTVVIRPVYAFTENAEFSLSRIPVNPGLSKFAMPLTNIDMPLRFGENSIRTFDLGDSYIQVDYEGFAAGFSNERIWTGPALYNPLIFSNNAPGFLHAFIGTTQPYRTRFGHFEGKWLWGGLKESDFFDEIVTNNLRYVTALTVNYSPDFIPGLHVGFTRAAYSYYPENGLGFSDLFKVFKPSPPKRDPSEVSAEDAFFSLMSFFGRYHLPSEGFEVYFEWGRNDNRRRLRDFISEPELNRGYVLGLIKRFTLSPQRLILLNSEITNLENSSIGPNLREFNIWYTNDIIRQGFTNRGQVLGASIGPGSATQMAQLSYYDTWGMFGASIARVAHFNDRHFKYQDFFLHPSYVGFEGALLTSRHEIEFRYGITGMIILPFNFELQASYITGKVENRFNRRLNDITNHHIAFLLRYNLPGFLR